MDANNLYGLAISQPLPIRDFGWMSCEEMEEWTNYGCILEVDLEYPEELHDKQNEYSLAPERIEVKKVEKLIPNLNNKQKYIIHHKTLKQCLSLVFNLTKIDRGVNSSKSHGWKSISNSIRTSAPKVPRTSRTTSSN
jgi:hypothetical protein